MKMRGFRVQAVKSEQERAPTYLEQRLLLNQGEFDHDIATALAVLSAWAYAVPEEFAAYLVRIGLPGSQCASLELTNEVLLITDCAYLIQSHDKQSLILCFRGTPPLSTISWASNMAIEPTPFYAGNVHSGFYGSMLAMWPSIVKLLCRALRGEELCTAVEQVNAQDSAMECGSPSPASTASCAGMPMDQPPQLYIAGHSLGGALSVLAAALIFMGEGIFIESGTLADLTSYQKRLSGVYTFGQPRVGDPLFAEVYGPKFGERLFRMVYEDDPITRLPSSPAMGDYAHFGIEYHATEGGWQRSNPAHGAWAFVRSLPQWAFLNGLAVVARVAPFVRWFGLLQNLWSWDNHLPLRYMRTSLKKSPYTELLLDYRAMRVYPGRG